MKIDDVEWMEWLHRIRETEAEACEKSGIGISEYLKNVNEKSRVLAKKWGLETVDLRGVRK